MTTTAAQPAWAERLTGIDLTELVDRAPLMTRVDRKYLIATACLPPIVDALAADPDSRTRVLEIEGRRTFSYRSSYLDTPRLTTWYAAARGRRRRFKARVRDYCDTGQRWLEVKTRGPRGTSVKRRIAVVGQQERLGPEQTRFVAVVLATERIDPALADELQPSLVTTYRRTTLHHHDAVRECRITLDSDLGFTSPAGVTRSAPGLVVVEVKAGPSPMPVEHLLWRHGHRPITTSKYGVGMVWTHPELPALKWRRALARHRCAATLTSQGAPS